MATTPAFNGILSSRLNLDPNSSGAHLAKNRDIAASAGYKETLTAEDFARSDARNGVAARIIGAPVEDTWNEPPVLVDGSLRGDSPFLTAWQQLNTPLLLNSDRLDSEPTLMFQMQELDRVSGIGRYGIMVLGFGDGPLSSPLTRNGAKSSGLQYTEVFAESDVDSLDHEDTAVNNREGRPYMYQVDGERIHYSRVIHVGEQMGKDGYGVSRLQRPWNHLWDVYKVAAAAGEAAWKLLDKGIIFTTQDGYKLPVTGSAIDQDELFAYINGLQRTLELEGLNANVQGGEITDPSSLILTYLRLISSTTRIPLRKLIGNEAGNLASAQDERNWAMHIASRRTNHVEPRILLPTVQRLNFAGILPVPAGGKLDFAWAPIDSPTTTEALEQAKLAAEVFTMLGVAVDPQVFLEHFMPTFPGEGILGVRAPMVEPLGESGEILGANDHVRRYP